MSPSASRSLPSMSSGLTTAVGAERFGRFEALVFVEARERFLVAVADDEDGEQVGREMWVEEVVDVGRGGGGGGGGGGDGGDEGEV